MLIINRQIFIHTIALKIHSKIAKPQNCNALCDHELTLVFTINCEFIRLDTWRRAEGFATFLPLHPRLLTTALGPPGWPTIRRSDSVNKHVQSTSWVGDSQAFNIRSRPHLPLLRILTSLNPRYLLPRRWRRRRMFMAKQTLSVFSFTKFSSSCQQIVPLFNNVNNIQSSAGDHLQFNLPQ